MEQNNEMQAMELTKVLQPEVAAMQDKFALACQTAASLQLQNNATAAFQAVCVVKMMRDALTDQVVREVFEPLMNTKIGFRTDKDPNRPRKRKDGTMEKPEPYRTAVVRDCIIDAVINGLMPTGNQFNIISGSMYPTREGYAALLKRIGCKYMINFSQDNTPQNPSSAEIRCNISFEYSGEKNGFTMVATVPKDSFSSYDQLKGKADRRAKKALYEYLTGCDLGDADEDSSVPAEPDRQVRFVNLPPEEDGRQEAAPARTTQRAAMESAGTAAERDWRQKAAAQPSSQQGPSF